MEPHAHISGAKARDVSHFLVGKPFHISQHENDAVLRRQLLNRFAQTSGLLAADGQRLWINRSFLGQIGEFTAIGHQLVERKVLLRRKFAFAATHQAAILRDFIKPDEKGARALKSWEIRKSFHEDFLHGVFGVFPLPANFHAEREDRTLQQFQSLFKRLRVLLFQKRYSLFDLFSHGVLP